MAKKMMMTVKKLSIVATAMIVVSALVSTIILSTDSALVSKRVTTFQEDAANVHILFFTDVARAMAVFSEVALYAQNQLNNRSSTPGYGGALIEDATNDAEKILYDNEQRLSSLITKWKHTKRGRASQKLRRVNTKIHNYADKMREVLNLIAYIKLLVIQDLAQFDLFTAGFHRSTGDDWEIIVAPVIISYEKQRDALTKIEKISTKTSFTISLISFIVVLLAITLLAITQLRLADAEYKAREAEAKINAQSRLVRQQCHETRSRFGPAVSMMQAFLEAKTMDDYRSLRQDTASALSVLKEVEQHQQTRLDIYKILKGNYKLHYEIFDLALLLNQRCGAEWTISRLLKQTSSLSTTENNTSITTPHSNVRFCLGLPTAAYNQSTGGERDTVDTNDNFENLSNQPFDSDQQNQTPEIPVKTDVYILSHLLNNLLSNSRKHTYVGAITVYFLGTHNGKLIFQVRDDGVGIPLEIRDKLFAGADVATADLRGTGLGLSSCQVFARCAEGYVRLVKSELQGATNDHGYSVFEFAVKGEVLENKAAYVYDPHREQNFVVRDAVYDCTEQDELDTSIRSTSAHSHEKETTAAMTTTQAPETKIDSLPLHCVSNDKEEVFLCVEKEENHDNTMPNDVQVIIIDDSAINRSCVRRSINATAVSMKRSGFEFYEYETCEAAQPHLSRVVENPHVIVTIDQSLHSRGGVLTGTDLIKWLTESLKFKGILISSSGDAFIGQEHLELGAHVAWGKPLPSKKNVKKDLIACFTKQHENVLRRRLNSEIERIDSDGNAE